LAVSAVRRSGVTKIPMMLSWASRSATARACSCPSTLIGGSCWPPVSESVPSALDQTDEPWRTSTSSVAPSGSRNGRW
jgi:hypothetical protein